MGHVPPTFWNGWTPCVSPLLFRHLGLTDVFHFMQSLWFVILELSYLQTFTFTFVHSEADPEGGGDLPMDGLWSFFSINKRLLMRRQFTTNISTRNILWRLKSAETRFRFHHRHHHRIFYSGLSMKNTARTTVREVEFSVEASTRTPLGSSRRSPEPLVGWGGGHPLPFPTTSTLRCLGLGASNVSTQGCRQRGAGNYAPQSSTEWIF